VPISTTVVYAFRRNAAGTGIDGAWYAPASNAWSTLSPAPPSFGPGQTSASGAGVFGASDGSNVWLFSVASDAASSILYTSFNGTSWTPWATLAGTGTGTQVRRFLSGYPRVAGGRVGLIWTEGTTSFDVVAATLDTDTIAPSISMSAPPIAPPSRAPSPSRRSPATSRSRGAVHARWNELRSR
jgi:hypothetical protein